jgi:alkylation response protein AidB-like acyl-CoA dehydrogenase
MAGVSDLRAARRAKSAADAIERARKLRPTIEAAAAEVERQRELSPELLAELHAAKMFRLLLPRSVSGEELDPVTYLQVIEELAKADGSTAWCVAQASGCSISAAYLRPEVAREIFGAPDAVLAWGPSGPNANATRVEGGYRVSGTWMFASGSRHAQWLGGHSPVVDAQGAAVLGADGKPRERTVLFPKSSAKIADVWHVVGLKGTGSDTYSVADLFVPNAYSFTREAAEDRRESGALYRFTTFQLYGVGFAGVALGLGRACLDAFIELAGVKAPKAYARLLRENAVIQAQVALCEAKLESARAFLLQILCEMWESATRGEEFTMAQRAALRLAGTYAVHQAKDVVDTVYHAAGATAIFESNPFERRFRDVHTVIQQIQAQAANFELVGQLLLGMPSGSKLI